MKIRKNFALAPGTDYEIRRLAKVWGISIARAWERCCHYTASLQTAGSQTIDKYAEMRQAEAKVEMLKSK